MKKFVATGELAGKTFVLNDRYAFVKGEMPVSDSDAEKIKPILCQYHACELQDVEEPVEDAEEDESKESPLKKK